MFWGWETAMTERIMSGLLGAGNVLFFYLDVKDMSFYNNLLNCVCIYSQF